MPLWLAGGGISGRAALRARQGWVFKLNSRTLPRLLVGMSRLVLSAWQPFTPRGVGRFATASTARLLAVQCVCALFAAAAVTWCVRAAWFPVVQRAVQNLPDFGEVRSGRLRWGEASPQTLAEGRCLALVVDFDHGGDARGAAHVSVELGSASVRIYSLFGYVDAPYPADWAFALNRSEALPWWGAWSPVILAGVFGGTVAALVISWAVLALMYAVPVWVFGQLASRALGLRGAWRLSGAAQMPGALWLAVALVAYGLGVFDPVRLLVAFGAHLAVTWVYLLISPLTLPPVRAAVPGNPFAGESPQPEAPKAERARGENPFRANAD